MKERTNDFEDTLRPHYDLDKLEVVAYGPGWKESRKQPERRRSEEDFNEAVRLLRRVLDDMQETPRAEELKERIESFLDRVAA